MYKKIVLICGMPRSGTSWLGQIFDSSTEVAFRMEPLFSYRFKNAINDLSSKIEIERFLKQVYLADDDFINQRENRRSGAYESFKKSENPETLVLKTTRHHELLRRYLELIPEMEIVSIVRHPCAVINSWVRTDREFGDKGCSLDKDWRAGACRKDGPGEYWGFSDWVSVTKLHVELAEQYKNFSILKYSDLVDNSITEVEKLFANLRIEFEPQTLKFLHDCHNMHSEDPYSVFKDVDVRGRWETQLDRNIAQKIKAETASCGLQQFLDT